MTLTETRLEAVLDAAMNQIRATLTVVAARVSDQLGTLAQTSGRIAERDLMIATQFDLRRNSAELHQVFAVGLRERINEELSPRDDARRKPDAADWQTLSLVDDSEMEERMFSDRIGQQISHACEAELRELTSYMGSLMKSGRAEQDRNPLRAEVLGTALYRAIEVVSNQPDTRKLLARELGAAMAKAMPECYGQIIRGLQTRGVQPVVLTVRQVEGPGNQLSGLNSAYASLSDSRAGHLDAQHSGAGPISGPGSSATSGRGGDSDGAGQHARTQRGAPTGWQGQAPGGGAAPGRSDANMRSAINASQADAQLMALLRHLTAIASQPGALDGGPRSMVHAGAGGPGGDSLLAAERGGSSSKFAYASTVDGAGADPSGSASAAAHGAEGLTGLMAVNLIRAHREELMQASGGKLDHMVIDVVGSLFDQILSDTRVPPQMARQIARLQLPVLRVALVDQSFFSSRRHPVRRFVNRIASLACAFDDFDDGPGKHFLDRVSALVQEIVEGDFDQIDLYASKLAALEAFIADQTQRDAQQQGTASTLGSKEGELRLQQSYMLQLQGALKPLALPDYLRDFLSQVWSQALVLAASRDGGDSDRAKRYRRVGRDIVMSVQPKGSPPLRKRFLMQLPPLMKDLNEGLALIGWPDAAQRDFFAKLLPAHAESLKGAAQSELDHNMMVKQLEAIFNTPVPGMESLSMADAVPEVDPEMLARRFSPEEAKRVGLVSETAVDWAGPVGTGSVANAADLDAGAQADGGSDAGPDTTSDITADAGDTGDSSAARLAAIDVDLSLTHADPAEPTRGPQLVDHIKLGFAYQMHLKDEWQKVRLAHVSAGRSFFVFTRGKKHQETISMTARMVARMCETGRMRAVESTYLMERATHRARKQLAALGAPTRQ